MRTLQIALQELPDNPLCCLLGSRDILRTSDVFKTRTEIFPCEFIYEITTKILNINILLMKFYKITSP